ncbi:SDR family NAD(P)-dependent oxidoreductase [Acidaminobacter sp. JC074]|uniref:NmrA family NAD(P)-binding protein n=1 Tax=Acidaminobacter sp. JC074 TaxID=2530199 RepID=UPI001F0E0764|nr:NmrA family NAD(P)-binding protein [Acidaminobacter sp. JC074]MCH4889236.1 SDR family NAD(P)-dependent oxidoreductase [Acidaminobacter sp. JC074]
MNRIFVTGATGNIGKSLVEELKKNHADFTCGLQEGRTIEGVKTATISFDDVWSMADAMAGHDTVFILAPLSENMKAWSLNILKAAKLAKVKHVVRSSGYGSDVNSKHMLLKEHGLIDKAVMESGMDYTITRPNTFMQNFAYAYGASIKEAGMLYLPNADAKITYSDVRDVGEANAKVLMNISDHKNKIYNLLGAPIRTDEIALSLGGLLNKEVRYVPVSVADASKAMLDAGMPKWVVEAIDSLNEFGANGGTDTNESDLERLLEKPSKRFEDFARDYLMAWQ